MSNDPTIRAATAFAEAVGATCAAIARLAVSFSAVAGDAHTGNEIVHGLASGLNVPLPRASRASLLLRSVRALADRLSRAALTVLVHSTHPAILPLAWLVLAAVERLYHGIAACETTL